MALICKGKRVVSNVLRKNRNDWRGERSYGEVKGRQIARENHAVGGGDVWRVSGTSVGSATRSSVLPFASK